MKEQKNKIIHHCFRILIMDWIELIHWIRHTFRGGKQAKSRHQFPGAPTQPIAHLLK
jgi:hypothetical protein